MLSLLKGLVELIRGMGITGKHLGRHAITIQYPEEKMEMFERSRGVVVLLSDKETGELNCTGCELCMRACPTAAIFIEAPRDPETKRKSLNTFVIDNTLCCFCGLCEEACNFSALKMAPMYYEMSTQNREDLVWDMDKLQQMGRDVPYEDKRKKKPVKKVAPKPVAEASPATNEKVEPKPTPTENTATEKKEETQSPQNPAKDKAPVENKASDKANDSSGLNETQSQEGEDK